MQISIDIQDDLYTKLTKSGIDMQEKIKEFLQNLANNDSYLSSMQYQKDKAYFQEAYRTIKEGKEELLDQTQYDKEMEEFFKTLWKSSVVENTQNPFKKFFVLFHLIQKKRAFSFLNELDKHINDLTNMPYKFRKSIYFDDENIRDLIFKGYVIVYEIDSNANTITIIGITKYQNSL